MKERGEVCRNEVYSENNNQHVTAWQCMEFLLYGNDLLTGFLIEVIGKILVFYVPKKSFNSSLKKSFLSKLT